MRLIGHNDMGGRGDCMHVNVQDGVAYVGHMGESRLGTTMLDVSDPRRPEVIAQIDAPDGIHTHKVQVVDDVMLVNHERYGSSTEGQGGLAAYDISEPDAAATDRLPRDAGQGRPSHDLVGRPVCVGHRQRRRVRRPIPDRG